MIGAGRMDQRVTLQQRASGADALGQEASTWANVATVWAAVTTERGREFFAAGAVQAEARAVFRIRWRSDLVAPSGSGAMRLLWRGQPYDITAPAQDEDGRRAVMTLFCATAARDGQ